MPRLIVALLFTLLPSQWLSAQVDSILSFPESERPFVIYDVFARLNTDRPLRLEKFNELQAAFESRHDKASAQLAWTLKQDDAFLEEDELNLKTIYDHYQKELLAIEDKNWDLIENEIMFRMGSESFNHHQFGQGMELMMESFGVSEKEGWSSVFTKTNTYQSLGHSYFRFGDIEAAIQYLKSAVDIDIPKTSKAYPYKIFNSIGLCFQELGEFDSAVHYLTLSRDHAMMQKDTFWAALTSGNIGNAFFKSGDVQRAIPYIELDYKESIRANEMGSAVNASCLLANIELKKGNIRKAEEYLRFATDHLDTTRIENMVMYYSNLFEYSKQSGDDHKAVQYADLLSTYKARKDKLLDKRILDQAKMKVAILQYDTNIKSLESARSRHRMMRNALLVILLLGGVVALLLIKRIQLKRQMDLEQLAKARDGLSAFTKSLLEKNDLIQKFKAELEQLKERSNEEQLDRLVRINELSNLSILTDDDWKRFRQLFDIVHPGFLIRLREKFADLTPAEMRLLALVKLQLPVKDMADMLGISSESIYKTRYRLRKKINLPEEGNLEELVELV